MATQKNSNSRIIPANANRPDEGHFVVVYGKGGIGKTTTACMAAHALLLDCGGGGREQRVDTWRIHTAADLGAAIEYLESQPHPYRTVILDGVDALYLRTLKSDRDIRKAHKAAQDVILPLLARFSGLPINRVLVLNERVFKEQQAVIEDGEKVWKTFADISMNLSPKLSQWVDDNCDLLIRAENTGRLDDDGNPTPTTIRVVRVTESQVNVQAKTRVDIVRNKMPLTQALVNLGIIADHAAPVEAEQPALDLAGK